MSHNNHLIRIATLPAYIVLAVLLALIVILPKAGASGGPTAPPATTTATNTVTYANYADCIAKYKKNDLTIRKSIASLVDSREKKLTALNKTIAKLPTDQQDTINTGITADVKFLDDTKASTAKEFNIGTLRTEYCQVIFKPQVDQYRGRQVAYLQVLNVREKNALSLQAKLQNPYYSNIKSTLKTDIDTRLATAKTSADASVTNNKALIDSVVSATVDPTTFVNNLPKLKTGPDSDRQTAVKSYTEAIVIKYAAPKLDASRAHTINSVELQNTKGEALTTAFGSSTKAVVTVKSAGVTNPNVVTLERPNPGINWKVTSAK